MIDVHHDNGFLRPVPVNAILDGARRYVVLNLAEVTYINSPGVGSLILLHKRLERAGGKLVLSRTEHVKWIRGVLDIESWRFFDNDEEAIAYFEERHEVDSDAVSILRVRRSEAESEAG